MKFSEVVRGTRSDEDIELPRFDGQPEDVPPLRAKMRALNGIEEEAALTAARKRAIKQGVEDPKPDEPIFDLALMVETVAIAILDPDSTPNARKPFFDAGGDQIRQWYGREAITLIYELQQDYQDRVAPTYKSLSPLEFIHGIDVLGGEDEDEARRFFIRSKPGLRWTFMRTSACQQRSLLWPKSGPGTSSEKPSKTDEKGERQPQPT